MTPLGNHRTAETGMRLIYISGEPTTPGHQYRVVRPVAAAAGLGMQATWMAIYEDPGRPDGPRSRFVVASTPARRLRFSQLI